MKKQIIILSSLSLLLLFQCSSDDTITDPKPIQEPEEVDILAEDFEVEGYKLTLTEIYCEKSKDQGDINKIANYYGYISAWASFDDDYITTTDKLETDEKTVLFYRVRDHWLGLKTGQTDSIEKSFVFYFNKYHVGKAYIHLDGWIKEKDNSGGDEDFGYQIIEINVEDIISSKEYQLEFRYGDDDIVIGKFKFEKFLINSDALTYPQGSGTQDSFDHSSGDYPPPSPISYTSSIPISKKYVILQEKQRKLYPQPNKVELPGGTSAYVINQNPKFLSDSDIIEPEFKILCDVKIEDHDTNCECLIEIDKDTHVVTNGIQLVGTGSIINGPKISEVPKMQIIQYWIPLKTWRIPAGTTKTYNVTYHHGWEETQEFGISVTLGYEAGATGFGKFSSEIESKYNYSISKNYSKEERWETSFAAPDDKNVVYVTWQRVNEIRLINSDGTIFKDENYYFSSMPVAHIPSNDIIDMAYQFNAGLSQ